MFDCLWAMATGMSFQRYIGHNKKVQKPPEYEPTLPRWYQLSGSVTQKRVESQKTGDELIEEFFTTLKVRGGGDS